MGLSTVVEVTIGGMVAAVGSIGTTYFLNQSRRVTGMKVFNQYPRVKIQLC